MNVLLTAEAAENADSLRQKAEYLISCCCGAIKGFVEFFTQVKGNSRKRFDAGKT
jgi:hypothetical protein